MFNSFYSSHALNVQVLHEFLSVFFITFQFYRIHGINLHIQSSRFPFLSKVKIKPLADINYEWKPVRY